VGKAKGGAIEGGLASIAPANAGDFADGGIVGYAEGTDKYGVPYSGEAASAVRSPYGEVSDIPPAALARIQADKRARAEAAALDLTRRGNDDTGFGWGSSGLFTGQVAPYGNPPQPTAPTVAAAPAKSGIEQLDPVEKKKAEEAAYGLDALARLRAGSMASAGPAPTVAGVRQQQQEARGNGLEQFQQDMTAQGKQVDDEKRKVAEKYQQGLEKMYETQGIVGEHRRSTIEKQQAGLPQEETDMKNNALLRAGLAILAAPPGGGAFAAIARGALPALEAYGVDKDKFMARKNALDESMNKLLDAQQIERGQRGESRLKAQAATDALEVEAKQRMYDLVGMVSKQKNITDPDALFKSFSDQFKDWRTSNTHVGVANAGMNARLGIAGLSLFGGGAGGGKPMSQAQFDSAVAKEVKLLQGQAGGAAATPQALEARARSVVLERLKREAGATPAPAGLRLLSVEPD
jgi:hypothetical protein